MEIDLRKTLQDSAYVTVGLAVISFQQAQVRRREAGARLQETRVRLGTAARDAQSRLGTHAREVRARVEPLVDRLQHQVSGALHQGRARIEGLVSRAA
ncbi:MAG: hypothetical protein M5U14_11035 [Acidimicrobiia bacterium]|nr:hypothetical protein [Acidimicrobiia bacterium]